MEADCPLDEPRFSFGAVGETWAAEVAGDPSGLQTDLRSDEDNPTQVARFGHMGTPNGPGGGLAVGLRSEFHALSPPTDSERRTEPTGPPVSSGTVAPG